MEFPEGNVSVADPTSARIVSRARQHFFLHGFRGVTMDDLAEELGMSKKTLYAHFRSKGALLEAVLDQKFRDIEAECDAIGFDKPADFAKALRTLLACIQRNADELQPAFLRDMRRESPDVFRRVEERRHKVIERYFSRLLAQGAQAGVVRKDIKPELILEALLGAVQAIVNPHKLESLGLTPRTAFDAILELLFHGIMAKRKSS
jgi:AcrR family transcriptional regulator